MGYVICEPVALTTTKGVSKAIRAQRSGVTDSRGPSPAWERMVETGLGRLGDTGSTASEVMRSRRWLFRGTSSESGRRDRADLG